ncbi:MAG: transposase, partial [Chloroflexi bacterium]|nr:transposase [Chloroflexota bacterium]
WFYNTLRHYQQGGRAALSSRSRAPHTVHNRTPVEVEQAIIRIRETIMAGNDPELRYANYGADMIAAELKRTGFTPPGRTTINRILKKHDKVFPRPRRKRKRKLPGDYPWPQVTQPNQVHLFDFVTRVLVGGGRFYGAHLLDQARHWPYLAVISHKTTTAVSAFLVSAWQKIGLPNALYMDNDVVWRGSSSGQRTFSRIVRLCLLLGVQIIFTPPYTPEANPHIESFNRVWDHNFWQRTTFRDLHHVRSELSLFQRYCRHRRPLRAFDNQTADHLYPDFVPTLLESDFTRHQENVLPLTAGYVHFIRFVHADGTFTILNEAWALDPAKWAGKTIRAMIDTAEQQIFVYHQADRDTIPTRIAQFDYPLPEKVAPLAICFKRQSLPWWPTAK